MPIVPPSSQFPIFPEVGGWEDRTVPRVLFGADGRFARTSLKEPIVAEVQPMVSPVVAPPAGGWVLGFMAITSEQGFLGALLVTNSWGRPLEFRLTTAINPSRVQQILYGQTLESHIIAELIGRALLEKSAVVPHMVLVDHPLGLDLQAVLDIPVVYAARREGDVSGLYPLGNLPEGAPKLFLKKQNFSLELRIQSIIDGLPSKSDLLDPFIRAQEAMVEARKLGAGSRAA